MSIKSDLGEQLKDDEKTMVAFALLADAPGTDEKTIERLQKWASDARTEQLMLDMMIAGRLKAKWDEETQDWAFALPTEGQEMYLKGHSRSLGLS